MTSTRLHLGVLGLALWLALPAAADPAGPVPASYPVTIAALQERYVDEVRAHRTYGAYAAQAEAEGYPNIAHLFRALGASEAIHARNFRRLLEDLGAEPAAEEAPLPPVGKTRENIARATGVEADEIDNEYPAILDRIRPEGHAQAIEKITWAWEAERQHRDLILKIKKAAGSWFGLLASHIENEGRRYYVCQICGSTVTELPAAQCPICGHSSDSYEEVPGYPGKPEKPERQPWEF